ncbi:methionyl-tRNA formyltransferase [bacterium]|nr:methionyl-tRNA formyltransferase [bacterium]
MKIVVIGYSKMFAAIVESVLLSGHELVGVMRHDRVKYSPFKLWLKDILNPSNDISFIKSKKLYEIKENSVNSEGFKREILKLNPDIIFVCSWSEKIKKEIFQLPKIGMVNVHPSLLPKYRGPNPYAQVLFNNEQYTGVTFHLIDEGYDSGAILMQQNFKILDSDDGMSLRNKAAGLAALMCKKFLEFVEKGVFAPEEQNESEATYQKALTISDAILDLNQPSNLIAKKIKGLYPWAKAYLDCEGKFLVVKKYKIEENIIEASPRSITAKFGRNISVATVDNKIITFIDTKLVKTLFSPSTRLFIKYGLSDKI